MRRFFFLIIAICALSTSCRFRNTRTKKDVVVEPISAESIYSSSIDKVALVIAYRSETPIAQGSAFFIGPTTAVTNHHVISGCDRVELRFISSDDIVYNVRIARASELYDLALLETDNEFPFLSVDSLYTERIGTKVYTIGNPHGFEGTISEGIISGKRESEGVDYIQITAPISPGNSGGPLLNEKGAVIGVSSFTFQDSQNLNFAVPIKYISRCVEYVPSIGKSKYRVTPDTDVQIARSFWGYSFGSSRQSVLQGMRNMGYSIDKTSEGFLAIGTNRNPIQFGGFEWEFVDFKFHNNKLYNVSFCVTSETTTSQLILEHYNYLIKQLDDKYAQFDRKIYNEQNAQWSDGDTGVICRYLYMDSDGTVVDDPSKKLNMYLWYYDINETGNKWKQDNSEL